MHAASRSTCVPPLQNAIYKFIAIPLSPTPMDCLVRLEGKTGPKSRNCASLSVQKLRLLSLDLSQPTLVPGTDLALRSAKAYESRRELLSDVLDSAVPRFVSVFKSVRAAGLDRRGAFEGLISLEGDVLRLISKN